MARSKSILSLALVLLFVMVGCGRDDNYNEMEEADAGETMEDTAPSADMGPAESGPRALAVLQGREGTNISGTVTFTPLADGTVRVVADVLGVDAPGAHGFHIHENGDCSAPDFTSAGGHFNPTDTIHGSPADAEHHAGDLGNLDIGPDGSANVEMVSSMLSLDGPDSVVGRAVILHEGADDFVTQPTGDAGGRLACGVIQIGDSADMDYDADEPGMAGTDDEGGPA